MDNLLLYPVSDVLTIRYSCMKIEKNQRQVDRYVVGTNLSVPHCSYLKGNISFNWVCLLYLSMGEKLVALGKPAVEFITATGSLIFYIWRERGCTYDSLSRCESYHGLFTDKYADHYLYYDLFYRCYSYLIVSYHSLNQYLVPSLLVLEWIHKYR